MKKHEKQMTIDSMGLVRLAASVNAPKLPYRKSKTYHVTAMFIFLPNNTHLVS